MKNSKFFLLLSFFIFLSGFIFQSSKFQYEVIANTFENTTIYTEYGCKHNQCHAIAKSTGNRCLHCVSNSGDSYCWQHK